MLSSRSRGSRRMHALNRLARVRRFVYYPVRRIINLALIAALILPGVSALAEALAAYTPAHPLGISALTVSDSAATPTATLTGELTPGPAVSDVPADETGTATLEPSLTPFSTETATSQPTATPMGAERSTGTPVPEPTSDSLYAIAITDLIPAGLPLITVNVASVGEGRSPAAR